MNRKVSLNVKGMNWKAVGIIIVVIMILITGVYGVRHFMRDDNSITFEALSEDVIPQKLKEVLPRYKALERALACKVENEIYVVVTRGEKPTGGYTVEIDGIEKVKEDDKTKLVVYAAFTDPKPGDVVTQAVTYPYVVVKTDMDMLPDKIELKVKYNE
ncbi:MAG: protease complex subunit PrcB family protein [Bacillota bacterium]